MNTFVVAVGIFITGCAETLGATAFVTKVIDIPGAYSTYSSGINDSGQIVGVFNASSQLSKGFLLNPDGSYQSFTNGDSRDGIAVSGINNSGQITGFLDYPEQVSFVRNNQTLTTFGVPGAIRTEAYGINDQGVVAGSYTNAQVRDYSFTYENGTLQLLRGIGLHLQGINNRGEGVGYQTANGTEFAVSVQNGVVTPLPLPANITTSIAYGLNDSGAVVGYAESSSDAYSFVYQNGVFEKLLPGVYFFPRDINNNGQIVGFEALDPFNAGPTIGVLLTPVASPEPASKVMLLIGISVLGALSFRQTKS